MRPPSPMPASLDAVRHALADASRILVLTGAGVSAESGVPVFRGAGGLWHGFRPEELATPAAFDADPARVWAWYRWRRAAIADARPNLGHDALAAFERRTPGCLLATQNVDGLHQRAGSRRVLELHGNIWRTVCERRCGTEVDESPGGERKPGSAWDLAAAVPRCRCGARLRPGVVWFGEALDERVVQRAYDAAAAADVTLVIGTSSLVYPAAGLPLVTLEHGGRVAEVNPDETPLSARVTWVLRGQAGAVCPMLLAPVEP